MYINAMRILNEADDKTNGWRQLFLTIPEASDLRDTLNGMLVNPIGHDHGHVSSTDYRKEVKVCICSPDSHNQFDERSKGLIPEDK